MKKFLLLGLLFLGSIFFVGCSDSQIVEKSDSKTVKQVDTTDETKDYQCKYEYSSYTNKLQDEAFYSHEKINYNVAGGYASNLGHCVVYQSYDDGKYPRTISYKIEDVESNITIFECNYVEGEETSQICNWNLYDKKLKELGIYGR